MNDLISRQDAVDACMNGKCANNYDCAEAIKKLSSVQLKQPFTTGWICPICGRGLAPHTSVCPCKKWENWEITW